MQKIDETTLGTGQAIRLGARVLSIAWSLCWIVFGLTSGIGEGMRFAGVAAHTALPGLVFLLTAFIAWRIEGLGGILILVEGLAISAYYLAQFGRISAVGAFFVIAYATLPSILIGGLFIASWRRTRALRADGGTVLETKGVPAA